MDPSQSPEYGVNFWAVWLYGVIGGIGLVLITWALSSIIIWTIGG